MTQPKSQTPPSPIIYLANHECNRPPPPGRGHAQEVTACRWVSLAQLRSDMAAQPQDYTVWFREEMAELDFFGVGRQ